MKSNLATSGLRACLISDYRYIIIDRCIMHGSHVQRAFTLTCLSKCAVLAITVRAHIVIVRIVPSLRIVLASILLSCYSHRYIRVTTRADGIDARA
jgi:hypothetical protein